MKNFIKKKLRSILYFIELNLRIKVSNKNPIDIYLDKLSQDCYALFEKQMKYLKDSVASGMKLKALSLTGKESFDLFSRHLD